MSNYDGSNGSNGKNNCLGPKSIQRRSGMMRRRKDWGSSSNGDIIVSALLTHIYHH